MRRIVLTILLAATLVAPALAKAAAAAADSLVTGRFLLSNGRLLATWLRVDAGRLIGFEPSPSPSALTPLRLARSDGGFLLEVVRSDWQAPGKVDNADNLCRFTAADFRCIRAEERRLPHAREVVLLLRGPKGLSIELTHTLPDSATWLRRRIRVFDGVGRGHFLHALYSLDAVVTDAERIVKPGGFGQPVALALRDGCGAFFGLEWPAADNSAVAVEGGVRVRCGQEIGEVITAEGIVGETVVMAATPDERVKYWFERYLDTIRAAPLRPYTLYNSWYDLRSAEYPRVTPDHVMNEANVLRIARLLRENMIEKHGITLDAFVLDDGWDVYESDWALRTAQFPRGLAPIADELRRTRTRLGLWLGPTGGYSFHKRRVAWLRDHGYETTDGDMWVGGPKYSDLLIRRTTGFARAGVRYFKWDGFRFLGTGPDLGTPPGIYARRAALKRVQAMVDSVRAVDPDMFLNITSGTWLSPWWLRFADQIWMGGEDYGASDVPSLTTRDASITYRDLVLHEDFRQNDFWFPLANLMTHGILKGTIDVQDIGKGEPLSKFADEVVFYLARGVTMHELYISPDVLGDGEWRVLADALRWSRDRFPTLKHTTMIGGDPNRLEPYGYAHWDRARGVIAVRNPDITPHALTVTLDTAEGLDPVWRELVIERVYPTRWVAPDRYVAGAQVTLPALLGYEVAVYEVRSLAEVAEPLLTDVVFEEALSADGARVLNVIEAGPRAGLLSLASAVTLERDGRPLGPRDLSTLRRGCGSCFVDGQLAAAPDGRSFTARVHLEPTAREALLCVLLRPPAPVVVDPSERSSRAAPSSGTPPELAPVVTLDGRPVVPQQVSVADQWMWLAVPVTPGVHTLAVAPTSATGGLAWEGSAAVWLVGAEAVEPVAVTVRSGTALATGAATASATAPVSVPAPARPLPSSGRGPGELPRSVRIGEVRLGSGPAR